jgi:hypothetical protein
VRHEIDAVGIGADELFCGYPSVHAVPSFTAWNRRLAGYEPLLDGCSVAAGPARADWAICWDSRRALRRTTFRGIFTRGERVN